MAGFEDAIARMRDDPDFADEVRAAPELALREYELGPDDLRRIERIVDPTAHPSPGLFRPLPPDATRPGSAATGPG